MKIDKQLAKRNIKTAVKLMIYLPFGFVAAIALLIIFATKGIGLTIIIAGLMAAGVWMSKTIWKVGLKAARKAEANNKGA